MRRLLFVSTAFIFAGTALATGSVEEFTKACLGSTNLGKRVCECSGRKAKDRLSPLAFEFLIATLQEDKAKVEELRPQLSMPDAMQAGMFMVGAPAECAQELESQ